MRKVMGGMRYDTDKATEVASWNYGHQGDFSYSKTVSRPDFRELSPFEFTNVQGGFNVAGNPNLLRAKITNYDGRWEWFLGGNHLLAASFFTKNFTDPIESTVQPTTDLRSSFINAKGAVNRGFEVEMRGGLGSVSKKLR